METLPQGHIAISPLNLNVEEILKEVSLSKN
jgi:hypothetical protein